MLGRDEGVDEKQGVDEKEGIGKKEGVVVGRKAQV